MTMLDTAPSPVKIEIQGPNMVATFDRFDLDAYQIFIKAKRIPETQVAYDWRADTYTVTAPARFAALLGIQGAATDGDLLPLADHLFDYQAWIVRMALDARRFAVWADTGLGKTPIFLEWARQVAARSWARVLILAPLQVIGQVREMAAEFYGADLPIEHLLTREALAAWCIEPGMAIGITNYEKFIPGTLDELRHLAGLVADECFPKGTQIDTPAGRKCIEDCTIGDRIINAAGIDLVSDVHRREVPYAVRFTVAGEPIVSSPNHPVLTFRGWVCAQDLIPGDAIMATAAAVRMVRDAVCTEASGPREYSFLRSVLLSEMADASARAPGEGAYARGCQEARREEKSLVCGGVAGGAGGHRTNQVAQSNEQPGHARKGLPHIESDEPQTFRAWGQRSWFDGASADLAGCTRTDLGGGVSFVTGRTDSRLSVELQARLSRARAANQYRGGWKHPLQSQGGRPEEGCQGAFARVDGLEILEPGHPDLERLRDADGKLYFYDLGGTRHPSFSVNGLLVHNSSVLKTGGGVIKWNLIKSARGIDYKLSCTATPAPNDTMEYASQAAFLEKIRAEGDVLWTYFTRDKSGNWRVKPHARKAFYAFMATWSVYVRNPAHFGFADILASLPEPDIREYELPISAVQRELMYAYTIEKGGGLFSDDRMGVVERTKLSQLAKGFLYDGKGKDRTAARIESAKPDFVADLVREDVLDGRQVLVWTVFDEESEILAEAMGGHAGIGMLNGSMPMEQRLEIVRQFKAGDLGVLVSKAQLIGYGMNFQNCRSMVFSGFDDSFERMYQSIRRAYRYGQTETVRVHVPYIPELEGMMFSNVKRKQAQFDTDTEIQEEHYRQALAGLLEGVA